MKLDLIPMVEEDQGHQRYILYLVDTQGNVKSPDTCYLSADHRMDEGQIMKLVALRTIQATEEHLKSKRFPAYVRDYFAKVRRYIYK